MAVASAYVTGVLVMCWFCASFAYTVGRRRMLASRRTIDRVYYRCAAAAAVPWLLLLSVGEGWLGLAAVYLVWLGLWHSHARETPVMQRGWTRLLAAAHGVIIACVLLSVNSGQEATAACVTGAAVGTIMLLVGALARGTMPRRIA
jgi:hypothetical protein